MQLAEAFQRYSDLLDLAESKLAADELSAAAALAQVAARYAFPANVGLFGSPRLERLLLRLGARIPVGEFRSAVLSAEPRRVLHVLSYAKPIGGDSRFAWRWIQQDPTRCHSVAITSQLDVSQTYQIPQVLQDAVMRSGGFLRALRTAGSRPMEQAQELRELCREADVIVLHAYPYDIIPVLALASGCDGAKTVLVNHSDHTFWVGSSVADIIVHLRTQSAEFLETRRGLDPSKSTILPIPLDVATVATKNDTERQLRRAKARRALGFEAHSIVLLTIASPFKYEAPGQTGFLELVMPVIQRYPKAQLIAIGPAQDGAWSVAHANTQGRIVALGRRWGNDEFLAAADIYLDSVPFSSITSLLEAGSCGLPLIGIRPPRPALSLLGAGAPGLTNVMELAENVDSYQEMLGRLINDEALRRQVGQRTQSQIHSLHTGQNWTDALEAAYQFLDGCRSRGCVIQDDDTFEGDELCRALVQLFRKVQGRMRVRQLIGEHVGALPYRSRVQTTWQLYRKGFELCLMNFLPPPSDAMVRGLGRRAKKVLGRSLQIGPRASARSPV